jgi:hypothetical protein
MIDGFCAEWPWIPAPHQVEGKRSAGMTLSIIGVNRRASFGRAQDGICGSSGLMIRCFFAFFAVRGAGFLSAQE